MRKLLSLLLVFLALAACAQADEAAQRIEALRRMEVLPAFETSLSGFLDLEDAWDLEDEREESEEPLCTFAEFGGAQLGYDRDSRTFYCPLQAEDWPELSFLLRSNLPSLQAAWIDNPAGDELEDAVSGNNRYEFLLWTDDAYEYAGIVFTGLPVVVIRTEDGENDAIGDDYVPAYAAVTGGGEALSTVAEVHRRGGGYRRDGKFSLHVQLLMPNNIGGYSKRHVPVFGMDSDCDYLLIGNANTSELLCNHLAWELWREWNGDAGIHMLHSQMVECFFNDQYMGLYQFMQRIKPEKELERMGGRTETDYMMRLVSQYNYGSLPYAHLYADCYLELRQKPITNSDSIAFSRYLDFARLNAGSNWLTERATLESWAVKSEAQQMEEAKNDRSAYLAWDGTLLSDDDFLALSAEHTVTENLISYFLFSQITSLPYDNVKNNLYIYALWQGKLRYLVAPWDMDESFNDYNMSTTLELRFNWPVRLLDLDAGARKVLWQIWNEKQPLFEADRIAQWMSDFADSLNTTGATIRDGIRWGGDGSELYLDHQIEYTTMHIADVEAYMREHWPE